VDVEPRRPDVVNDPVKIPVIVEEQQTDHHGQEREKDGATGTHLKGSNVRKSSCSSY
jgi:hypothetical protein